MVGFQWLVASLLAVPCGARAQELAPSAVHYYVLQGEVDRRGLNRVLHEASTEKAEYRLLFGPVSAPPRPKEAFIALEAPVSVADKDVERLLKKACKDVEELVWTSFSGGASELPSILGQPGRDCIIGMASEMRWFHQEGDRKFFFHVEGKLAAEEIGKRFKTLFEPFHAGEIGTLVVETVHQALAEPVDPARVSRALKVIQKLHGVQHAELAGNEIVLEVELESQSTGGHVKETPQDASLLPRPCFDLQPVLAILAKEGLRPAQS
jgi:hypothetical protein